MSDRVSETMEVGPPEPDSRRSRVTGALVAALVVLAGVALVASEAGWLGNDHEAAAEVRRGIAHPLPSNPRALTAAVLTHVPDDVTVVWSSASGGLAEGTPGIGPAATLRESLASRVLMRVGREEFFLSVVIGPSTQAMVPGALADGLITRDRQGRPVNEMLSGSANGRAVVISESASPTSHADLPLSDAELKAILADPLVGVRTDAATLASSRTLESYTESPPPLTWEP